MNWFICSAPFDATIVERFRGHEDECVDLNVHVISIASAFEALQTATENNVTLIIVMRYLRADKSSLFGEI